MVRTFAIAAVLSTLTLGAAARAEEDAFSALEQEFALLEELMRTEVKVSSARPSDVFSAPSTVAVIDRRTIELYGFESVSAALETLAGVHVGRTYLKRSVPSVRGILQDHYANKVLVLIDGVPAWLAVTGEGSLDRVDVRDLERIEVLKGPASVLYGTNAYSAAINLVLRHPEPGQQAGRRGRPELRARAGDGWLLGGGARFAQAGEDWSLMVAANGADARGREGPFTDERGETGRMREYLVGSNFTLHASRRMGSATHALLFNGYGVHESSLGVVPTFAQGVGRDHYLNGYLGNYALQVELSESAEARGSATFDWNQRSLPRSGDDLERAHIAGYRATASAGGLYRPARWLEIEAGGEFEYRRSQSYANVDERTGEVLADNRMAGRSVWEGSLLAQARLDAAPLVAGLPLSVIAGARLTHNELFDTNLSLRASAVYSLWERSSLKLVAAQSYRAPTLFELYFQTPTNTVWGNPELSPERSNSIELGWVGGFRSLLLQVLGYYATYDDRIFRVRRAPDDPSDRSLTYINGGRFAGWGAEVEARYSDPRIVDVFANYAFERGDRRDEVNGHYNFKYVAEHSLSVGLARAFGAFTPSTVVRYLSSRGGPSEPLPAQVVWDASASLAFGPTVHRLSVENLLDARQVEPEYVRRSLNEIPAGYGRRILYTLSYTP